MEVEKMKRKDLQPFDFFVWVDALDNRQHLSFSDMHVAGTVKVIDHTRNWDVYRITFKGNKS